MYFTKEVGLSEEKTKLRSLSSRLDLTNTGYESLLDDAFSADKSRQIRNIAIAGKYGSGKSSIVDSYFSTRTDSQLVTVFTRWLSTKNNAFLKMLLSWISTWVSKRVLRISVAAFKSERTQGSVNNDIYIHMMNQLVYQINPRKIPLTGFRVKKEISTIGRIVVVATLLASAAVFLKWQIFKGTSISVLGVHITNVDFRIFVLALWGMVLWLVIPRLTLSKISLKHQNVSADLNLSEDDLFERYVDEVIYLFEKSGKRILVIEDLDRFNDISIFENLRELNTKLNARGGKNWQFVYLIKDDLFTNETDRVKFFDLIIPIVPYMTTANSYDKFTELTEKLGLDSNLIYLLSLYISDYRLLTNIVNEYKVFKNVTKTDEKSELLSLVAYKNLYPKDFDKTQDGKGILADIFDELNDLVAEKITDLTAKKESIIVKKDETIAHNKAQYLYLNADKYQLGKYVGERYYQSFERIGSITEAESIVSGKIKVGVFGTQQPMTFNELLKNNAEFANEIDVVTRFNEMVTEIDKQIYNLQNAPLRHFVPNKTDLTSQEKFIYTLIVRGYLTPNYMDTVNRFYGDEQVRSFLKSVFLGSGVTPVDLDLPDISTWWNRLEVEDFKKVQVQNYSVLKYAKKNDTEKYKIMLRSLSDFANNFAETVIKKALSNLDNDFAVSITEDIIHENAEYVFDLTDFPNDVIEIILHSVRYERNSGNIDNIVEYFNSMKKLTGTASSVQESALDFINDQNQWENAKSAVIRNVLDVVEFSDIADSTYYAALLEYNKVKKTLRNILFYFESFNETIDRYLLAFIATGEIQYDSKAKVSESFWESVLSQSEIKLDVFEGLFNHFETTDEVTFSDLPEESRMVDRVRFLAVKKYLTVDQDLIDFFMQHHLQLPDEIVTTELLEWFATTEHGMLFEWLKQFEKIGQGNPENWRKIFANTSKIWDDEMIEFNLEYLTQDAKSFRKVWHRAKNYQNLRFTANDINKDILKWFEQRGYQGEFDDSESSFRFVKKI